jgi:IMP dehydrogenase
MKLVNKYALSFNDILLVPQFNEIKSRLDTDLSTRLTNNINIKHPICSTNMSTITEFEMMKTLYQTGSAGFLHRFMPPQDILNTIKKCKAEKIYPIVISVGVKEEDKELVEKCLSAENTTPDVFLIDIAHGHSSSVIEMIKFIKSACNIDIIAGNICTREAAKQLASLEINGIRCGVGGSKVCQTRNVTGSGMPTLQSIIDCKEGLDQIGSDIPIIADGGFKFPGDLTKGLACGCESFSLGTLLSATSDTPGDIICTENGNYKRFSGMASKQVQELHRSGLKKGTAPEGISIMEPYKGETIDVLEELLGAIRSGLTYSGAKNLEQLRDFAEYVILSPGSMLESKFI